MEPKDDEISGKKAVLDEVGSDEQVHPAEEVADIDEKVVAKAGDANDVHENEEGVVVTVAEQNGMNESKQDEGVAKSVDEVATADEKAEPQDVEEACLTDQSCGVDAHEAPVEDDVEDVKENGDIEEITIVDIDSTASPRKRSEDEQVDVFKTDTGTGEKESPVEEVVNNSSVDAEVTKTLEPQSEGAPTDKTELEMSVVDNNREHLDVVVTTERNQGATATSVATDSATKEVTPSSCDSHEQNDGIVLGLLPRLGPSSGTTTTTTIEPFVLSSESNEMMEMHVPPQRWVYEVYGFSIENRVVYYHIHRSDRRTGIREPPILKRYTDFRELQMQLLNTRNRAAADMPRIPRPHLGTVFRGYKSKKTIEIRERAFRALLRYIAQYPFLHGSAIFERFITTSRAVTGAGWM